MNDAARIIISQRGGRIFGPFMGQVDESLLWTNSAFADAETFRAFLDAGDWNLGGERVYIGPELQYSVPDRKKFWDSYTLSPQVDPGNYELLMDDATGQCKLQQDMLLNAYPGDEKKALNLTRELRPAADPLRNLSNYANLIDGVAYCGYEQSLTLGEEENDGLISQTWDLTQINPGGTIFIPALPTIAPTDYYGPVDETWQTIESHYVRVNITGDKMFKLGYRAPQIYGRAAYFNVLSVDKACLIVRNFYNNPTSPYLDEPYHSLGCKGDSLQIYQDDGALGGFAEIECIGQAIGGFTDRSAVTDNISLWCYVGTPENIRQITYHLVGVMPDQIK
ncbi:MAG: hypothetical protein K8R77_03375 [Anaerolineaceae bacterium]|nr:hypothetical protein [Anaerolineaceae bacterium]